MPDLTIAPESMKSLHVRGMRPHVETGALLEISQGTAFVIEHLGRFFLVTNIHVLTGHDPVTGKQTGSSSALPSLLKVWHNSADGTGNWAGVDYQLYDEAGRGKWLEHPSSSEWDIAVIEIGPQPEIVYHPYTFTDAASDLALGPGSDLSIVGFPFGVASDGKFAIWSRASVASDPDLDYTERPAFLVDSRSRPGQSGSPVILKATNGMTRFANGELRTYTGQAPVQLFGIYSGRINDESDLGIVWKARAIRELIDAYHRTQRTYE